MEFVEVTDQVELVVWGKLERDRMAHFPQGANRRAVAQSGGRRPAASVKARLGGSQKKNRKGMNQPRPRRILGRGSALSGARADHIRRHREIRCTARGNKGLMRSGTKETRPVRREAAVRRANRRLNGMAETAGLPDPPTRGRLARTLALLDAALKVWETNHPRDANVWRHQRR